MRKSPLAVLGLCFSLVLSQAALPALAFGHAEIHSRPRIVRNAPVPLGVLDTIGIVSINGRPLQGRQAVWNGELIQATTPVAVALPTLGKINVANGGAVQVRKAENPEQNTLLASVYEGEAEIAVAPTANAYVEAGGKAWVASGAALLKLSLKAGQPVLETRNGNVQLLGNWSLSLAGVASGTTAVKAKATSEDPAAQSSLLRSIKQITRPAGSDAPSSLRLFANARAAMLGMIESAGKLKLNGRTARSQELLWNGELIQPETAEARVALHGLARVNIAREAGARLSTATAEEGASSRRVLMGNLLHGEMTVRLEPNVAAYVETQGKTFAAEPGAHFRLSEQAGQVTLEIKAGIVRELTNFSMTTKTALSDEVAAKANESLYVVRPADKGGYLQAIKPGESQNLRFLVTDRTGKPAAALPVVFSLNLADAQPIGTLGVGIEASKQFTTRTDEQGIAVVPFNAGRMKGSTSITAVVAESAPSNSNVVVVNAAKDEGFWTKRNAIPVFAAVGGAVAAGIIVGLTRDEPLPIQGRGSATIVP